MINLLSGCILSGERPQLSLDIPRFYRAAPTRAVDAALPKLDWWRGFHSPELSALMEEAQVANLDNAAAVARIVQADANARIAGAPLLPAVDLVASAQRSRPSRSGSGVTSGSSEHSQFTTALTASYTIDFWGKNRATLRAAEETAVATRFDREVVALSTLASVANAYFQILAAQDRLRIAQENLRSATRILTLIQQRLAVGTASSLDIAQQQSLVATQRAAIPPLEQQLRQSIVTLAVLIGRAPASIKLRGGSMSRITIPRITPGLPSELLTQRPDIREAEAQLAAANANVYAARAAFLPNIQLTGDGGWQSAALKSLFTPQAAFYTVAASLTQPIFQGGLLMGQLDLILGRQDELLALYRKSVISAFADVENALIATQLLAMRESLQREAVASSRRAYEISETRLREGTVDLITVLNTQQTLFQAQDTLMQVRLQRLQAIVSLFQALGGGWPPDRREILAREAARLGPPSAARRQNPQ